MAVEHLEEYVFKPILPDLVLILNDVRIYWKEAGNF